MRRHCTAARRVHDPAGRGSHCGVREQQVEKALRRGLGLVVGEARTFVGFDEQVLRPEQVGQQQVQPDHRDIQRAGRLDRCVHHAAVQPVRDVVQRAAGVEVRCLAHRQDLPFRQDGVHRESGIVHAALGLGINGDAAFPAGGGGAPAALCLDELPDGRKRCLWAALREQCAAC